MPGKLNNNSAQERYELSEEGEIVAIAVYRLAGDEITFVHTEVPPEHEGKGYAKELARQALDEAGQRGMQVVPVCKFFAAYIRRHRQYASLLSPQGKKNLDVK